LSKTWSAADTHNDDGVAADGGWEGVMTTPIRAGLFSQHGKALFEIGAASGLGIIASAGFQVVATRGLGPESFGLLAAFLALINIAAIGSSALRNSVAVAMAESRATPSAPATRTRWLDSSLVEALVLGGACTVGVLVASPWLASSIESNVVAMILTAATVTPYFLFARAQGLLQGVGDSRSVVWWSTGAQLGQLVLALIALALGYDAIGILVVFLISVVLGTIGSTYHARKLTITSKRTPFSVSSTVVLLLTIAFAWLTNVDVILVRAGASELVAGSFAAAAVLVKTTLILPATLSLYLLPRFVSSRGNHAMTKLGVNLTLAVTFAGGLVIFLALLLAGELIVAILFGPGYELTVSFLPALALMWLPWAMTQAVLVRITSFASKAGLAVLLLAAVVQWVGSMALLPDVTAMIILNGSLGVVALLSLYGIHLFTIWHDRSISDRVPPPIN
jgi:O-antigen/teichoic acid export membrane protein